MILEEYATEALGRVVEWGELLRSRSNTYMLATPDGREGNDVYVEIKNSSQAPWEEAPIHYQFQCQQGMAVTGFKRAVLVVCHQMRTLRVYLIERNESAIAMINDRIGSFWENHVLKDTPPEASGAISKQAIKVLYPSDGGEIVELGPEASQWDWRIMAIRESMKELEAEKETLEAKIMAALGQNSVGLLPGGGKWTWKTVTRKGYTVPESSSRQLRRTK